MKIQFGILFDKLKTFYMVFTMKERIYHYASSLSFYNIFSIIPLFLMIFSILSNFSGFQAQVKSLQDSVIMNLLPQNSQSIMGFIETFLQNSKTMGLIGFIISLFSTFIFFRNYEDISSHIFHGKKRNIFDSFIIYWILITLTPTILVISFYFSSNFVKDNALFADDSFSILSCIPFVTIWIFFALLFRISANRSVNIKAVFFSSLGGAIVWSLTKYLFLYYMSYNKFYSTIYGSVSIIMFLFLWIYISWIIFLIAMRTCYMLDIKMAKSKMHKSSHLDSKTYK